jgi:hypothetical protein
MHTLYAYAAAAPAHSTASAVLQLGTCYMHLGYDRVVDLLEEYGLGDEVVELGRAFVDKHKGFSVRRVWDLNEEGDYERADGKSLDFGEWQTSAAADQLDHLVRSAGVAHQLHALQKHMPCPLACATRQLHLQAVSPKACAAWCSGCLMTHVLLTVL